MNIKLSIAMYFSYFVLFARFFYKTYLSTTARKGKRSLKLASSSSAAEYSSKQNAAPISSTLTTAAQTDKVKAQ